MKLSYRRTFSQFIDTYIFTYYSAGIGVLARLIGGPLMVVFGIVLIGFTRRIQSHVFSLLLWLIGLPAILFGLYYFLRPFINLALVWLRREEFLGAEGALVTFELVADQNLLHVSEPTGDFSLGLEHILYIQHRADSAWIITDQDQFLLLPRHNLVEGDQDEFISAVEQILDAREQKH